MNRVKAFSLAIVLGLAVGPVKATLVQPVDWLDWSALHTPEPSTHGPDETFDGDFDTFGVMETDNPEHFDPGEFEGHVVYDMGKVVAMDRVRIHGRARHGPRAINPTDTDVFYYANDDPNDFADFPDDIELDPNIVLAGNVVFDDLTHSQSDEEMGILSSDVFTDKPFPAFERRYVGLRFNSGGDPLHNNGQYGEIFFNQPISNEEFFAWRD